MQDFIYFIAAIMSILTFLCFILGVNDGTLIWKWFRNFFEKDDLVLPAGSLEKAKPPAAVAQINEHVSHFFVEIVELKYNAHMSFHFITLVGLSVLFVPFFLIFFLYLIFQVFLAGVVSNLIFFVLFALSLFWFIYNFPILPMATSTFATPTQIRVLGSKIVINSPAPVFEDSKGQILNSMTFEKSRVSFGTGVKKDKLRIKGLDTLILFIEVDGKFYGNLVMCPRWFAQRFSLPDLRPISEELNIAIR